MTVAIRTVSVALCTAPVIFLKSKNSNYMKQIHFTIFYLEHMKTTVINFFNLYKKRSKFSISHSFYLTIREEMGEKENLSNKKE